MLYIRSLSRDASLESWLAWPLRLSRWNTDSDPEAHLHLGGRAKSCSRGDGNKRILGEVRQGGAQLGSTLAGLSGFFTLSGSSQTTTRGGMGAGEACEISRRGLGESVPRRQRLRTTTLAPSAVARTQVSCSTSRGQQVMRTGIQITRGFGNAWEEQPWKIVEISY